MIDKATLIGDRRIRSNNELRIIIVIAFAALALASSGAILAFHQFQVLDARTKTANTQRDHLLTRVATLSDKVSRLDQRLTMICRRNNRVLDHVVASIKRRHLDFEVQELRSLRC